MGRLFDRIRAAVADERYFLSVHAQGQCEERDIEEWQIISSFDEARLLREQPRSKEHPSVVLLQTLENGD